MTETRIVAFALPVRVIEAVSDIAARAGMTVSAYLGDQIEAAYANRTAEPSAREQRRRRHRGRRRAARADALANRHPVSNEPNQ